MPRVPITKEIKPRQFASIFHETDLGAAIIAGVLLETQLLKLLNFAEFADMKGNVPLDYFKRDRYRDFNEKINVARKRKRISTDLHDALHVIREVRNEAAHGNFEFNLDDVGLLKHMEQLKHIDAKADQKKVMQFESFLGAVPTHRMVFAIRCHIILNEIQECIYKQVNRLNH